MAFAGYLPLHISFGCGNVTIIDHICLQLVAEHRHMITS